MQSATLDGQTFKKLLSGGAANLQQNSKTVDDLNVFPIPDGDTGENMSRTIRGGLSDLEGYGGNSIYEAASILADGMLLSARGNSGVILSRLFYGVAKGLEDKKEATVGDMAAALKSGVDSAYSAVANPTEGTILTVAREAADYAASRINENSTLESFGNDYYNELCASLKRTPELLSVLKEAGVIDSGGAGLYYIMDGIMKTVRGEQPEATEISVEQKDGLDLSLFDENSVMTYGYCTEFLLRLQNSKVNIDGLSVEDMIKWLNTVGDSVVAFKNGTAVKVHVHTLTPGKVLEHFQQYGEFLTVKIENMTLQHSDHDKKLGETAPEVSRKKYATVTVATGQGKKKPLRNSAPTMSYSAGNAKILLQKILSRPLTRSTPTTFLCFPTTEISCLRQSRPPSFIKNRLFMSPKARTSARDMQRLQCSAMIATIPKRFSPICKARCTESLPEW